MHRQLNKNNNNNMKNTLTELAAVRRYMNTDYIFATVALAGCAALLVMTIYVTVEAICR